MGSTRLVKYFLVAGAAIFALGLLSCTNDDSDSGKPIKVALMLPVTGEWALGYEKPALWAISNINKKGGIDGRKIELVNYDLGVLDHVDAAKQITADPEIVAAIGTDGSSSTFEIASMFIKAKKILITPAATSAEIFRAFGGKKYIWRTVESDIAQVRTMMLIAAREGVDKLALITSTDVYGATFFDWFGFFATELGIGITKIIRYDQGEDVDCTPYMEEIIDSEPQMIIAVNSDPRTGVCMVNTHQSSGTESKLLFSDGGTYDYIPEALGEDSEGLRGTSLAPDPLSGFNYAYNKKFHQQPSLYAANTYDAMLLIGYGLAYSSGQGGEALADGMTEAVKGRGEKVTWDDAGIGRALKLIKRGDAPDISGATGPLMYDSDLQTDVISSIYGYWEIEDGQFVIKEYISSDSARSSGVQSSLSVFQTLASEAAKQKLGGEVVDFQFEDLQHLKALIISTSESAENYRHQSDAFAAYQLLKSNGVSDDDIIFIVEDDVSNNGADPIYNEPGGEDIRAGAEIDYRLSTLNASDFYSILYGNSSTKLKKVIESDLNTNIFVFIVGHGIEDGVIWGNTTLKPELLASTIRNMARDEKFRRMFIEIEACFGGSMGTKLDTPGVILYAGANPYENSFGANYDADLDIWLADQFAYNFNRTAKNNPDLSLSNLYEDLYLKINGSHVSVYNSENFGDLAKLTLKEFITPPAP